MSTAAPAPALRHLSATLLRSPDATHAGMLLRSPDASHAGMLLRPPDATHAGPRKRRLLPLLDAM